MSPGRAAAEIKLGRFDNWIGPERVVMNTVRLYNEFKGTGGPSMGLGGTRAAPPDRAWIWRARAAPPTNTTRSSPHEAPIVERLRCLVPGASYLVGTSCLVGKVRNSSDYCQRTRNQARPRNLSTRHPPGTRHRAPGTTCVSVS